MPSSHSQTLLQQRQSINLSLIAGCHKVCMGKITKEIVFKVVSTDGIVITLVYMFIVFSAHSSTRLLFWNK